MKTREERQSQINKRVSELRAQAENKEAEASRLRGNVNDDPAFWTQPAYSNAAGRSFSRQRDRERNKIEKACALYDEAKLLRDNASSMEARGVVMAGDAEAARQSKIASVDVHVGQMVNTTFYGIRKVLKVNQKSVLVEGGAAPLKVEKQYIRAA